MKQQKKWLWLILAILLLFTVSARRKILSAFAPAPSPDRYLDLFTRVSELIRRDYVDRVNPDEKMPAALQAVASALDPLSAYLDVQQTKLYDRQASGSACTIGICAFPQDDYLVVTGILPASPAENAGLVREELIRAVNGELLYNRPYWSANLALITEQPATLHLQVRKQNNSNWQEVAIATERQPKHNGILELPAGGQVVQLRRIDASAVVLLEQFLAKQPPREFVLDLRCQSGGDWPALERAAQLLLASEVSLTLQTHEATRIITLGSGHNPRRALVAVVDASTVLYGELLAALLQQGKYLLVGEKTPGLVARSTPFPLQDGSAFLLSTGFYAVAGHWLLQAGVEPDVALDRENPQAPYAQAMNLLRSSHDPRPQK